MMSGNPQMAGLIWTAVTLSLLLYVENSEEQPAGPNQNQLSGIVNGIWNKYISSFEIKKDGNFPMFSLAVSIPYNNNLQRYHVNGVTDSADTLKATLLKCEVYKGERMVAATALTWAREEGKCLNVAINNDHAEYRTLTAFSTLNNLNKNDFMLFYVYASPCIKKCTGDGTESILNSIKEIKKWTNYSFVFTKVFKPKTSDQIPEEDLKAALERLGNSIGLDHIFRCDGTQCTSCSSGGQVTPNCYT